MKQRLYAFAAFLLTLFFVTGCQSETGMEDTAAETEVTAAAEQVSYRDLLAGKVQEFSIVCPDKKLEQYSGITRSLRAALKALDGGEPGIISDFLAFYPAEDFEIVLGSTTRTEGTAYEERISSLGPGEYEMALDEEHSRIYLLFSDAEGLLTACEALLCEVYPDGDGTALFRTLLAERGVQRYSFTCDRLLRNSIAFPAGGTQTFCGTASAGQTVTAIFGKGDNVVTAQSPVSSDGRWLLELPMPAEEDGYELLFQVNGVDCARYENLSVRRLGAETARGLSVSLDGVHQPIYETDIGAFVIAESTASTVTVTVESSGEFTSAAVQPSADGIQVQTSGKTVTFTAPIPSKLSLHLSGKTSRTVELFLYAPDEAAPQPGEDVLWFGPGEYTYEAPIALTSGQTVYLEAGAVVHAHFTAENANDITIAGRGIIDTYGMTEMRMINLIRCQNIILRDYTLIGPRTWMTVLQQCDGAVLENLNIIGSAINSDGIDIVGSKNVTVSGTYICANDDCIALKSNEASQFQNVENIVFRDCILWNQEYGNAVEIGYETRCEKITNILFEDIDIIRVVSGAALSIHLGDRAHVSDVTYRDIRVEDAHGITVEMFIKKTQYTKDAARGKITNITFDGLALDAESFRGITLSGYDSTYCISGVHFSDVTIDGKALSADRMKKLKALNAQNITWDGTTLIRG